MNPTLEVAFRDFLITHPLQSLGSNTSQNIHVWYLVIFNNYDSPVFVDDENILVNPPSAWLVLDIINYYSFLT